MGGQKQQAALDHDLNPNNLWVVAQKAAAENKSSTLTKNKEHKKIFVFVGDKKTGKSNLINKLLNKHPEEKETIALDFKSGEQTKDEVTVKINTYEIGGGRTLANLLTAPLSIGNIDAVATICIVLDLSKPS